MQQRNPITVILLTLITFGIYGIYWQVVTKNEMNARGATIPTAWLLIVPLVNIWWLWKYCEGVEHVTGSKLSTILAFLVLWLASIVGIGIIQDTFNKVEAAPANGSVPPAPGAPLPPTNPVQ